MNEMKWIRLFSGSTFLVLMLLANAAWAVDVDPKWRECGGDKECAVVKTACGAACFNDTFADEARGFFKGLSPIMDCSMSLTPEESIARATPKCVHERCQCYDRKDPSRLMGITVRDTQGTVPQGIELPHSSGAAEKNGHVEPAVVTPIRKMVHDMDHRLSKWQKIVTDAGCEGDGCGKTTIWLDQGKHIRKIVALSSGGPAASSETGKYYSESYFDPIGNVLFNYVRNEMFKGQQRLSINENRYYVQQGKLVAWKTQDNWHDATDPDWLQAEIGVKSAGDAELAQTQQQIKSLRR